MHTDLAWAVLGVDPAIHKNLDHLASQQGISIGRCLELMIHSVSVKESRTSKERKQLRGIIAEMAESLMHAADVLDEDGGVAIDQGRKQAAQQVRQNVALKPDRSEDKMEEKLSNVVEARRSRVRRSA
jgi:hypothetical protein